MAPLIIMFYLYQIGLSHSVKNTGKTYTLNFLNLSFKIWPIMILVAFEIATPLFYLRLRRWFKTNLCPFWALDDVHTVLMLRILINIIIHVCNRR